ncbi:hypothetical protein GALL_310090 [mine drainage metagenome]|uniref:Uncharacterized protein n=1 Tax=mine drainage metagenome TaxID=410659 RepID=A0A1J5QTZ3_9ZZZZ
MKRFLLAVAMSAAALTTPAFALDVGASVSIGEPGFYGRVDIGGYPQPQVIYFRPRMVLQAPMDRPPIYLRVPPEHARHWRRYCREYDACGERVYFVRDDWYNREYVPRYRAEHYGRRDERGDGYRGEHGHGRHGDDHGDDRGDDHGHGRDH